MDKDTLQLIVNIAFLIIITVMAILSVLSIYILIKYGRTRTLSIAGSLAFAVLFILQSLTAFSTLQSVF